MLHFNTTTIHLVKTSLFVLCSLTDNNKCHNLNGDDNNNKNGTLFTCRTQFLLYVNQNRRHENQMD